MNYLQPKLNIRLSQKQILTPSLVQMVNLLVLNRLELQGVIDQELMANPTLEETTEQGLVAENYSDETFEKQELEKVPEKEAANPFENFDLSSFYTEYLDGGQGPGQERREREDYERPSFEKFLSSPQGLSDHLTWQLGGSVCSEVVRAIAEIIIGNLDENGYLMEPVAEIAQEGSFSLEDTEEALAVVQEMDPPGVAARDLKECLLIQLRMLAPLDTLARQIVSDHLPLLQSNQLQQISRALDRPVEHVKRAVDVIKRLDPRPGLRYNQAEARLVVPDVKFVKEEGEWRVLMDDEGAPQLRLSPMYRRMLQRDAADREVRTYVKERFAAAAQFLKNIEQRRRTIQEVCKVIVRRQADFLEYGPDHLRPMMIKEVAEEVGVHPSTVSRAVANKYTHTPRGVLELRSFFSESVNGPEGQDVSLLSLKRRVKKMIEDEDVAHPLTDDEIAKQLIVTGIRVTRRTVAKYREDMNIPSSHQRRVKS
jgi:RNA polymerase sigma-54 factor